MMVMVGCVRAVGGKGCNRSIDQLTIHSYLHAIGRYTILTPIDSYKLPQPPYPPAPASSASAAASTARAIAAGSKGRGGGDGGRASATILGGKGGGGDRPVFVVVVVVVVGRRWVSQRACWTLMRGYQMWVSDEKERIQRWSGDGSNGRAVVRKCVGAWGDSLAARLHICGFGTPLRCLVCVVLAVRCLLALLYMLAGASSLSRM